MMEQNILLQDSINQLVNVLNSFQIPTNSDEDSSKILLKIVKTLNAYHGQLLCHPTILSHGLFAKLRVCYRLLLKQRRRYDHSSKEFDQEQALSELGAFLCRLSIRITDENVHIIKQLFFNKSLIDELIDCFSFIASDEQDSLLLLNIEGLVSAFCRLQRRREDDILNDPMHGQLIEAVAQYLCSVDFKKEMITSNVVGDHRSLIRNCLYYLINFKGQRRRHLHITVRRSQYRHFTEWIQEQSQSFVDRSEIEILTFIDYMATILSTRLVDQVLDDEELNIYSSLFKTFAQILLSSKELENYVLICIMIKHLFTFSITNCLSQNILLKSLIPFLNELIDDVTAPVDDDDNLQLNACRLLLISNSYDKIDVRRVVSILVNYLSTMVIKNKSTEACEILDLLTSLSLSCKSAINEVLGESEHLDIIRQCATSYSLFSFDTRQKALDLFYSVVSIPLQHNDNDANLLLKQAFGFDVLIEQYLDMYDWSLSNWEKTNKDIDTIMLPIILQDVESLKSDEVIQKHQEKRRRINQTRIAKRNREDTIIVWIYDIRTITEDNLMRIRLHLESIRYNVCYFDISQNVSAVVDFILSHYSDSITILVDATVLRFVIDQISDAAHISSAVFVYNSIKEIPFVAFFSPDIQSCITALAIDVEWKTTLNVEFLLYESKQTFSAVDLTVSSAHVIWHLLLGEVLTNMTEGNHQELVSAVQLWYSKNTVALAEIDYFKITYTSKTPELWYNINKSTVIQRILQNAFKHVDIETIYFARSIIIDMSKKIASAISSVTEIRRIFTCSVMNKSRIKYLLDHQDSLIMPIGFLVGHVDRKKVLYNLRRLPNKNLEKVLFEIDVDNNVAVLDLTTDGVIFNIGILFQLLHIFFDPASQVYYIRLQTVSSTITKQLVDNIIQLREQVGECTNRTILFGSLLADMNCVRSAMNYFLFYNNYDPNDKEMEVNALAELGRISLRCNQLIDAEKFFLFACDLQKRSQIVIDDSVIGRIRIDLVLVLARQRRSSEANALCQETFRFLCDSPQPLSLILLNLAQGRVNLCGISDELAQATFDNLRQEYEHEKYHCQHPVLIGGNAIDIGDMYREKGCLSMAHTCYLFAYFISEHNQPNTHPMMLASLHRLSHLLCQKPLSEAIEAKLTVVCQGILNDNANSQEKKILADTGQNLALFYVKKNEYYKATTWFEMCLSIYRRQWPRAERRIHQCQAYILKHRLGLNMMTSVETPTGQDSLQLNDIVLSMEYEHLTTKHVLQEKTEEENRRWDDAMTNWKQNRKVGTGIVIRQVVVWIEPDFEILHADKDTQQIIRTSPHTDFRPFEDVDSAVFFLIRHYEFTHVQVVVANSVADEFFDMQELAQLQKTVCLTMCVFVLDTDETEEVDRYNRYLMFLQCGRKCWAEGRDHDERCLIMSRDRHLYQEFCLRKDTLGMTIAMIIRLVDIGGFGNMLVTEIDNERNKVMLMKDEHHHVDFVGFMSGYTTTTPKVFDHLRFAKPLHMPKSDVQIAALVMFGRRHNLTDQQIAIICRYFSTGNCVRSATFIKYLVRLWSLESPVYFYRLVNTALAECCVEDIHYLRFIIYDYLEMFYAKSLPYFAGTLYRGILTTDENIAMLMSLVGQKIYFVCFTATSKNRARALVGGNVLFEIETLSHKSQEAQKLYSNADISIVSQFSEEEEVLYAPLTTFALISVVCDGENSGTEHYTVKMRELGGGSFLSMLHLDKLTRMPNASPFQTGTDHWQININTGKCFFY